MFYSHCCIFLIDKKKHYFKSVVNLRLLRGFLLTSQVLAEAMFFCQPKLCSALHRRYNKSSLILYSNICFYKILFILVLLSILKKNRLVDLWKNMLERQLGILNLHCIFWDTTFIPNLAQFIACLVYGHSGFEVIHTTQYHIYRFTI